MTKRIIVSAMVKDEKIDEMEEKLKDIFGDAVDITVTDVTPEGSGLTLRKV